MFLLGTFDLTRCEAIPNIFISHPYSWTLAVGLGSDECTVFSLAFLLRSRREKCSRPPSENRSEHRLFCARDPGTGKGNTHFDIRIRIFIHRASELTHFMWCDVHDSHGHDLPVWHLSINQHQRERSPSSSSNTAAVAVGCPQLREEDSRKSLELICG